MTLFLILAAALATATALLIVGRAGAAARAGEEIDPTQGVYRRQLAEVDDLADRGLLDEQDRRQAFAEAARRLLSTQADSGSARVSAGASRATARAVTVAAGVAAILAIGLYMTVGSPGTPDAPFKLRLAQWNAAKWQSLDPAQMAAVLDERARKRPQDAAVATTLGLARLASGDGYGAVEALRRASQLAPRDADILVMLGQAQASLVAEDVVSDEAEASFRRALAVDPANLAARYAVAKMQIARGDAAAGIAGLRALQAALPAADARRAMLDADIAQAQAQAQGSALKTAAPDAQARMIQGMVDGLAARLKRSPDDPAGWAQLVKAYGVLGQTDRQKAALAEARLIFAGRPGELARVEAEATR